MATGKRVLPGAPVAAGYGTVAGRAMTAEQAIRAEQAVAAGPPSAVRVPARLRSGAGGRWFIWVLRAVVWAVLLLIGYRGVAAIVTSVARPPGRAVQQAATPDRGFPAALAQAYALEFGQVYLNYSPASAQRRATMLAAFLPPGSDSQLDWNGAGTQTLASEHVAGIRVLSAHSAVVTLLAQVGTGRLVELQVPVYAADGGLVVSGRPALLPAPGLGLPSKPRPVAQDPTARLALERTLPAFFRAFGSGDQAALRRVSAAGTQIRGLGGFVTFGGLGPLMVPAAGGATRHITVTVHWLSGGTQPTAPATRRSPAKPKAAQLDMTYAMTVIWRNGTWYVSSIGAAATQLWPPS